MSASPTYVVIDTMVFLHFRPVQEIPWPDLLNVSSVQLIISDTVVRELDKHKSTHPSSKIRERARRALKLIEQWAREPTPQTIRTGVTVEICLKHASVEWGELGLSPEWSDDRLLGVSRWLDQERGRGSVVVVSDDTGPRIKAQGLGLRSAPLPDEFRLPVEVDPLVEENRQLKAELARLSAVPRPKLQVEFTHGQGDGSRIELTVSPPITDLDRREHTLERLLAIKSEVPFWSPPSFTSATLAAAMFQPSSGEIDVYNEAVKQYYIDYEQYLLDTIQYEEERRLCVVLQWRLCNVGHAPAEDIDIEIHIPDGVTVREESEELLRPKPPEPPTKPQSTLDKLSSIARITSYDHLLAPERPVLPSNVSGPDIRRGNSYDVSYSVNRVKHGFCAELTPLELVFPDERSVHPMTLSYWIHTADHPEAFQGKLHVVMRPAA